MPRVFLFGNAVIWYRDDLGRPRVANTPVRRGDGHPPTDGLAIALTSLAGTPNSAGG